MQLFLHLFFLFIQYIPTSFIHKHSLRAHLHFFTAVGSVGGTSIRTKTEGVISSLFSEESVPSPLSSRGGGGFWPPVVGQAERGEEP